MAFMDNTDAIMEQARREFWGRYNRIEHPLLGEGTYGKVYKASVRGAVDQWVAIKEMKLTAANREEGVPSTALRETAILKQLNHPNVVRLLDLYCQPGELDLVFEYVDMDLKKHIKSKQGKLERPMIQNLSRQLLEGLEYCHANRIIHRDLKSQNLLLTNSGTLKIADFGLARAFSLPMPVYTHEVITVWYRPLEILLGSKLYSLPVDMWGVGCIIAELATGAPLFAGDSEIDTAFKIFQKLGTPSEAVWPGVSDLPDFKVSFPKWKAKGWENIRNTAAQMGPAGLRLLDDLLRYNPKTRISARAALRHQYFNTPITH